MTVGLPRVLLVLPQPPAAELGAADRCSLGLLRGLRSHGLEVHAIAARQQFHGAGAAAAADSAGKESEGVEVVDVSAPRPARARFESLARPHRGLSYGPFGERVLALAANADVVHLEQIEAAGAGRNLTTPAVAHLHYRVLLDRDLGRPWQRSFRQTLEFVRAERAAARRFPWLIASSPRVADSLRHLAPRAEVVVAPLTLDPAYYTPAPSAPDAPRAGLIGTASWPPTATAIARMVGRVWPAVVQEVPVATFTIAGRGTEEWAARAAGLRGIEVVGSIPSAVEFLRGLSVLLYPIERGSGMKVKVLEALALGVAVVTTTAGAEGIPPSAGVVVADADDDFVAAAIAILRDPVELAERRAGALDTFRTHLIPEIATEPLLGLYASMARR